MGQIKKFSLIFCFLIFKVFGSEDESGTEFTEAIMNHDHTKIQELRNQGYVLSHHDLMAAVLWHDVEMIRICVESKISLNEFDAELNMTPLMYAVFAGYLDIVKELLKHGARVDIKNKDGHCAKEYANKYKKKHLDAEYKAIMSALKQFGLQPVTEQLSLMASEPKSKSRRKVTFKL